MTSEKTILSAKSEHMEHHLFSRWDGLEVAMLVEGSAASESLAEHCLGRVTFKL